MTVQKTLPAEWQSQSGVMLTWPHKQTDLASELTPVEFIFCEIAIIVSQYEQVLICSSNEAHTLHITHLLTQVECKLERIKILVVSSNHSSARDHGPITIIEDGKPVVLDFQFNGCGNKYLHQLDKQITSKLSQLGAFSSESIPVDLILEAGSIDSDGQGTLLTTSQCLLADSRNPSLSKADIEAHLKESLGAQRVLWLEHGQLLGDDTDSHIDMLARFINVNTICHIVCENKSDPHYAWLNDMKAELQAFKMANGQPYQLVELPFPNAVHDPLGQYLPASYCNFLIINKAVLVPIYNCPQDEQALEILIKNFPQHSVIAIDCRALIEQHSNLHGITMQLPAGVLADTQRIDA